jgi:hypothetical protein
MAIGPLSHPRLILPGVLKQGGDDGGGGWRRLAGPRQRIGLAAHHAVRPLDLKLVARARSKSGYKQLPDPDVMAQPHRMTPAIPAVEISDQADASGVGRPDAEGHAVDLFQALGGCAQTLDQPRGLASGDLAEGVLG